MSLNHIKSFDEHVSENYAKYETTINKIKQLDDIMNKTFPYACTAAFCTFGIWGLRGIVWPIRQPINLRKYLRRTDTLAKLCTSLIGVAGITNVVCPNITQNLTKRTEFCEPEDVETEFE